MHPNKWLLGIAGVLLIAATVAVTWLHAAPAPTVGTLSANPAYVVINTPTDVVFTISITDPTPLLGVNLLQVDSAGKTLSTVGAMHDDGLNGDLTAGDKVFSFRVSLNQPATGQVFYRASAAFKGVLLRSSSSVVVVQILNSTPRTAKTIGLGGGSLTDGVTSVTIAPGGLSRDLRFTLTTLTRAAIPQLSNDAVVYGAVMLEAESDDLLDQSSADTGFRSAISTPLFQRLEPGSTLVVLGLNDPGTNWRRTDGLAVVDASGWKASFTTSEVGPFILMRESDIGI